MKKSKLKLILLAFIILIFVLPPLLILSLHLALQSPSIVKTQLPFLQKKVREFAPVDIDFAEATINVLGQQRVVGGKIYFKDESKEIEIKIGEMLIVYSLWDLLHKNFVIKEVSFSQVKVKASVFAKSSETATETATAAKTVTLPRKAFDLKLQKIALEKGELEIVLPTEAIKLQGVNFLSKLWLQKKQDSNVISGESEFTLAFSAMEFKKAGAAMVSLANVDLSSKADFILPFDDLLKAKVDSKVQMRVGELLQQQQKKQIVVSDGDFNLQTLLAEEKLRVVLDHKFKMVMEGLQVSATGGVVVTPQHSIRLLKEGKLGDLQFVLSESIHLIHPEAVLPLVLNFSGKANESSVTVQGKVKATAMQVKKIPENYRKKMQTAELYFDGDIAYAENKRRLEVRELSLSLGDKFVAAKQRFSMDLQKSELQGQGVLSAHFKDKNFEVAPGKKLQGGVEFPWKVVSVKKEKNKSNLIVSGSMKFQNFSFEDRLQKMQLSGIEGSVRFSEEISLEKAERSLISFAYLVEQNPFERVDFLKVRPLLSSELGEDRKGAGEGWLKVANIVYERFHVGPLVAEAQVVQNMLMIKNFELALYKGDLVGSFYFDFHPEHLRAGVLGRLSGLRTDEIAKDSQGSTIDGSNIINARSALTVDFPKRLIEGRVDVTEIGQKQLLNLFSFIDPQYKHQQLNSARSVLNFLEPRTVSMEFRQGNLDLSLDLIGAKMQKSVEIRSIPIGGFLSESLANINKKMREVPIQ
ncbi:MAG: hypothetical protein HQK50_03320 [Oligoflexia bacterium]|nr:hypothetical protein [Oligoflexia bacterium]MBF0364573.1 hypothetical protein [Oligoflexia bacterium]